VSSSDRLSTKEASELSTQLNSTQLNDIIVHSRAAIGVPAQSTALRRKLKSNGRNKRINDRREKVRRGQVVTKGISPGRGMSSYGGKD
jgi:hypothetical protein